MWQLTGQIPRGWALSRAQLALPLAHPQPCLRGEREVEFGSRVGWLPAELGCREESRVCVCVWRELVAGGLGVVGGGRSPGLSVLLEEHLHPAERL